jgi:uncharacterized membrane protein
MARNFISSPARGSSAANVTKTFLAYRLLVLVTDKKFLGEKSPQEDEPVTIPMDSQMRDESSSAPHHSVRSDSTVYNVGVSERWMSMILGGSLLLLGSMRERARLSFLLAGSALLYRGAGGYCPIYDLFGFNTTEVHPHPATSVPHLRGIRVEDSILIDKPADELYRFWRSFENLPRFMSQHVAVERYNGDARFHWTVKSTAGTTFQWDAEIINDIPNELLAWRSLAGADLDHAGSVHFEKAPDERAVTKVTVVLEYRPPAGKLSHGIAKLFGQEPAQVISKDLQRLKQLMETGEIASVEGQPHDNAV